MVKTKKPAKTGGKRRGKPGRGQPSIAPKFFVRPYSTGQSPPNLDGSDNTFSLRDAARNADRDRSLWGDINQNLRSQNIDFVRSSDTLKGTLPDKVESPTTDSLELAESHGLRQLSPIATRLSNTKPSEQFQRKTSPTPSITRSDSSDEVIVFVGRGKLPQDHSARLQEIASETLPMSTPEQPSQETMPMTGSGSADKLSRAQQSLPSQLLLTGAHEGRSVSVDVQGPSLEQPSKPSTKNSGKKCKRSLGMFHGDSSDSDAFLADYMDNMRAHGEIDDDFVSQAQAFQTDDVDGWGRSDLADFDDMSTSIEVADTLESVLAKRTRDSGVQYLVVWQGQSVDEARWVHHGALSMTGAIESIHAFEEQEALNKLPTDDTTSSRDYSSEAQFDVSNGSEEEEGLSDLNDDLGDERDIIERRMARMTDEQIARLLSKQEELGMGSDDLVLFDDLGDVLASEKDAGTEDFIAFTPTRRNLKAERSRKPYSRSPFEPFLGSANDLLGDLVDDTDEGNFIRPGLDSQAFSKSKKFSPGLSDSDLNEELRRQFAVDRRKKKVKKQEREELRAQGLLGKKNKFKPDLSARYNDGLSISQFKEELEEFLFNGNDSLALPPLAKRERKIIHEIASQFNLKSKSVGSGKSRFPVLYKTSRSIDFDAAIFSRAERRFQRGFLPRMDTGGKGKTKLPLRRTGGGGIISGTGYAEGEAVGATAPELSSDNRGRAMLEKMGWSSGMALGALDNKGILQPIPHIVKKTRAGLG